MDLHFINNIVLKGARRESLKKQDDYLVAPVTAIVEGVLNGYYYSNEALKESAALWSDVPVPVNHPANKNGDNISARSPSVYKDNNIGRFFNCIYDSSSKALKGELWINIERANELGHSNLLRRIESGEKIEVSTGLFSNVVKDTGDYNGKPFSGRVSNIRPDHLAILPDTEGACSVDDGCGIRTNCENDKSCEKCNKEDKTESMLQRIINYIKPLEKPKLKMNEEQKAKAVDSIIANSANTYTEKDREALEATHETVLANLSAQEEPKAQNEPDTSPTVNEGTQLSEDEYALFKKLVANQDKAIADKRKLVVESYDHITDDFVANMSEEHLDAFIKTIQTPLQTNFALRSGANPATSKADSSVKPKSVLLSTPNKD